MKKLIAAFLIVLGSAFSTSASATSVEVGVGFSHATVQSDGIWYQNRFPHTIKRNSPSLLVGVTGDVSPYLTWHVDGIWLGRYGADSQDTPADANYSPSSPSGCNGECLPLAHYVTSGTVYGIAPLLDAHTAGNWRIGVEAGPFIYHHTWNVSVPNWYPTTQTGPSSFAPGAISPVSTHDSGNAVGEVVGFYIQHGNVKFDFRSYYDGRGFPRGSDAWPPICNRQMVGTLIFVF